MKQGRMTSNGSMRLPDIYATHRYRSLRTTSQIRLLELHPIEHSKSIITCSLKAYDFPAAVGEYTALSYSWGTNKDGDASLVKTVLVDNQELLIARNLSDALLRLRPEAGQPSLRLWVDAICINQEDIGERNAQVAIMAQIYSAATSTIIWLGEFSDEREDWDTLAMRTLSIARPPLPQIAEDARSHGLGHQFPLPAVGHLLQNLEASIARSAKDMPSLTSPWRRFALRLGRKAVSSTTVYEWRMYGGLAWFLGLDDLHYVICRCLIRCGLRPIEDEASWLRVTREDQHLELIEFVQSSHQPWGPLRRLMEQTAEGSFADAVAGRLQAVAHLLSSRYFSRRWVIQEIYHSNRATTSVRWGPYSLPFDDFGRKITALQELTTLCLEKSDGWRSKMALRKAERNLVAAATPAVKVFGVHRIAERGSSDGTTVLKCLSEFCHNACADDRDLLFAFASMSSGISTITPDYNLSAPTAFIKLARSLARNGLHMYVFRLALQQRRQRIRIRSVLGGEEMQRPLWKDDDLARSLPSWAPDFRLESFALLPHEEELLLLGRDVANSAFPDTSSNAPLAELPTSLAVRARLGVITRDRGPESFDIQFDTSHQATVNFSVEMRVGYVAGHFIGSWAVGDRLCFIPCRAGWSHVMLRPLFAGPDCLTLVGYRQPLEEGDQVTLVWSDPTHSLEDVPERVVFIH